MKTLNELTSITAADRLKTLAYHAKAAKNSTRTVAKVLVAASLAGDFGEGEMNQYAIDATGIELRRELQGTYEAVNCLSAIHAETLEMTEAEFDVAPAFGLITLSSFLGKSPEKVAECLEIIRSKTDVTNRLRALRKGKGKGDANADGKADGKADGQGTDAKAPETPDADTFVVPHGSLVVNHEGIMRRLVSEIDAAAEEDLEVYSTIFAKLAARVDARLDELTAPVAAVA